MVRSIKKSLRSIEKPLTVAVMGCVVNGPGEAREADIGIAGARGEGLIFKHGRIIKRVPEEDLVDEFLKMVKGDGDY